MARSHRRNQGVTLMNINYTQASAGSGKTHLIENDASAKLISGAIKPDELIAVTYTKKAANELQSRIISNLLSKGANSLATATMNSRIGTVHSIFGELIKDFAFELGLSPDIRVVDEGDKRILLDEALDLSISPLDTKQLNHLAERLQIKSWQSEILKLIEQMRSNNLDPISLTKFANDSVNSLINQLPTIDPKINEITFCDELRLAIKTAKSITKPTKGLLTAISAVEDILRQRQLNWQNWVKVSKLKPTKQGESILAEAMDMGRQVLRCESFQKELKEYIELLMLTAQKVLDNFANIKATRGLIDFVDQEQLALQALQNPVVQIRLREQIKYLIVDEFQDTSPLQLALFSKLSELIDDVLLVGDAKQAIYGFRGSDPKLALDVLQYVQSSGGTVDTLPNSWRSRPGLVHLCNDLFTQPFSHILTSQQVRLIPQQKYTLDSAELEWWQLDGKNNGERLSALALGIREHVDSQVKVWDKHLKHSRSIQWRDIAILCRSNDYAAQLAEECVLNGIPVALERSGILETPEATLTLACLRRLIDPNNSLASAEIISLASGLNASHWLDDRINSVISEEASDWNKNAHPILTKLENARSDVPLLSPKEALMLAIQAADIQQIVVSWSENKRLTEHRLANLAKLCDFVDDYEDHCKSHHLAGTVTGFVLWLRELEQRLDDDQAPNPGNAVNITTYHGSKGLEWPVVICVNLEASTKFSLYGVRVLSGSSKFSWQYPLQGRTISYWPNPFPDQRGNDPLSSLLSQTPDWSSAQQQAENEAIQLLYVGFTRARDQLILTDLGKKNIGEWLGLLNPTFLPAETGLLTLASGEQLTLTNKMLNVPSTPIINSAQKNRHWLPANTNPHITDEDFICPPSSEPQLSSANANIIHRFDKRIPLTGSPDMAKVGDAIHHCLSLIASSPMISIESLKQIILHYVPGVIDAADVQQCGLSLLDWIVTRYPEATIHTELPFNRMLASGQLQTGQIDLVLELNDGWIIIDHKSNPQPESKWCAIAQEYSGQLSAYSEALTSLSGKPVKQTLIHLAVSGGLVEVL